MTSRRSTGRGQPQATWKDPRRRPELLKAIGAGSAVVLITALIIFLIRPGDSSSTTPIQTPVSSLPSESTVSSLPTDSTASTTPSGSTDTTATTAPSTTTPQP